VEIVRYAETWSRKIEVSFTIELWREAVKMPHSDPVVIVAVRSDGSVESVTFSKSSGVPAIDEAILRVVDSQKPYHAFPPELSRDYDVIEIRRNWHFDITVRLY
jgi:TonB family protein